MSDLETQDGLKKHIIRALQLAKKDLEEKRQKANFVRIIMRFPQIKSVFAKLRSVHAKCDKSGDGRIDIEELSQAMTALFNEGKAEGREPVKSEIVKRTFSLSEVDEKGRGLDEKEFIVMCAIGFILAEEDKGLSTFGGMLAAGDDEYRRAMTDVVTAYLSFDREAKGYFTADEFNGFMTASKRADAARSFLTDERWTELDVSGDGKVEFEEFVYAFSKWVTATERDDDDDEDERDKRSKNPLTQRVRVALQLSRTILEKRGGNVNFTRIIMRFPKIHDVFDRIRSAHKKWDVSGDGHLELQELQAAMNELMNLESTGETDGIDQDQIENLFMLSDFHHDDVKGLDVKEFIVFCAVGFILAEAGGKSAKLNTGERSDADKEYRNAMMDIVGAYLTFDKEGKGYFTVDEMHSAVADCGKKDAGSLLTAERWAELDENRSGRVDFEEFVYAFSNWVTAGDDVEDDE
mmetsp:Transcript_8834/g.18386  ORF Transcript_8834/g.18386 Transcript_8834/m.18386 type:complete len:464 (-) Transcript_8834:13-1404(-)